MSVTASANPASARVLLVDDDEAGRYAKARILRQGGYRLLEAECGRDALRLATEEHPDLILLDIGLPDINGFEVCRRIKADPRSSTIPILQISASMRDDQAKAAGLQGGADGYIAEPVEPALLIATVGAFLRIRQAEQSVREHAMQWQATFDAITDGVALVDTDGRILRSNGSLTSLLNRPASSLTGMLFDELLPARGDTVIAQLRTGEHQRMERTAGERVFSLALHPVRDADGQLSGGVCLVADITERKLMDERLWRTQKLESIGVLAGGVAHDFNNLLMGILGNASMALQSVNDPVFVERALGDIVRAADRAADLTRQLLAYAGKGRFMVQPIDISVLVSGMIPLVHASIPRKVDVVLQLAENLPAIEADKTQIEQIIMNLVINAAEAIGESAGIVRVTTSRRQVAAGERHLYHSEMELSGEYVALEVRDTGAGMDEDTVGRIFDPFFTTKFMGRGLGLSAVLGIVRGHKGGIRVSTAPGQGATFELLFPASNVRAAERFERSPEPEPSGVSRGNVLVVDDEQVVQSFFRCALEREGYDVTVAADGAEALRIFGRAPERFSLVLLDMVMPVMSGKDVLPPMLEIRPDARVVITSGQVEEDVRRELGNWNIAGFIQKPCAVQPFLEKIRSFVE